MFKSLHLIAILGFMIPLWGSAFAGEMPYTDVAPSAPYASAVQMLYESRIIIDDGSHLFHPTDLMARDFFVSLAVGIGCHQCETPSITDIVRYQVSPFVDLSKINPHYYCIAYAKEYNIAQGYILNELGQATCENAQQYMSSPFCAGNTISRIEAAAILLRRAKLWDDTLNVGNFDHTIDIPDVTSYWYGYAQKGINIGIIRQKQDGKIEQDEKISRGEFAMMAARILQYTQCQTSSQIRTSPVEIVIRDTDGNRVSNTIFAQGSTHTLSTITSTGTWDQRWTITNMITGQILTSTGSSYPLSGLTCGTWINTVDLIEKSTDGIMSTASLTITIECTPPEKEKQIAVSIDADPLSGTIGHNINFSKIVQGGSGTIRYTWNYGDGTIGVSSGNTNHTYQNNGYYPVTLTVIDASGHIGQSSLVVHITGDPDTDRDSIIDTLDQCPLVHAQTPSGCPTIVTYNASGSIGGNSLLSTLSVNKNICIDKKSISQGLITGIANCTQCPCSNTISISSALRSCDIVFPTVLSPNLDTIYSRGGFYLIP